MEKGRSNKLAGQIGEYLVCAELGRRGYIATSFTGNVPEFDLIVTNDNLKSLPIQVKSSRSDSWPTRADKWINIKIDHVKQKQIDNGNTAPKNVIQDLIFVCVALAKPSAKPEEQVRDRFFILKGKDLQCICAKNYREWMDKHDWKRPKNYKSLDNRYYIKNLVDYEDNWKLIGDELTAL
jgi:Holliday junction resolvase-like predicted endonuclease